MGKGRTRFGEMSEEQPTETDRSHGRWYSARPGGESREHLGRLLDDEEAVQLHRLLGRVVAAAGIEGRR